MVRMMWKRLALTIGLIVGLIVTTAQPASAAPYWQVINLSASWHCKGLTDDSPVVNIRACIVVNGNYAQAVAYVGNRIADPIDIRATAYGVQLIKDREVVARDNCWESSLGGYLTRGCFGATVQGACGDYVQSDLFIGYYGPGQELQRVAGKSQTWQYCQ